MSWALRKNTGYISKLFPYQTCIGDIEISVKETKSTSKSGVTVFEVADDPVVVDGGNTLLLRLIGVYLLPFVVAVVTTAAALYNPLFGPLLNVIQTAAFRFVGHTDGEKKGYGSISLRLLPWWSLKAWNDHPGTIPLRMRIGHVLDTSKMPSSSAQVPAGPIQVSGIVAYEVRVTAETGSQSARKTGTIAPPPTTFVIDWS